jgi:hypothetical protein
MTSYAKENENYRYFLLVVNAGVTYSFFPLLISPPRKNEYILVFPPERSVYTHFSGGEISVYTHFSGGKTQYILIFSGRKMSMGEK